MISVICCTMRDDFMENVFQNYASQDFKKKELIIILNKDDMNIVKWKERAKPFRDISVYQLPKRTTLGECLNIGVKFCKYDIISKIDDDDYYAPHYLSDQIKAIKEKRADVVCKRTVNIYFEKEKTFAIHLAHKDTNKFLNKAGAVKGATLVIKKRILKRVRFPHTNFGEDIDFLNKCIKRNYKIYATDEKNYVCLRRSESHHTWNIRNRKLMKQSKILCKTRDYKGFLEKNKKKG